MLFNFPNKHNLAHSTFGSLKNGRNFSLGRGYRFGFNGKEKDEESFEGCVAFEARIFDSRIGKFLSTDPMKSSYPWQTPYAYFANSPISQLDILGMGGPYQEEGELKTANSSNEGNSSGKQGNTFSDLIKLPPEPKRPENTIAEWKGANKLPKHATKEARKEYKSRLKEVKEEWKNFEIEKGFRSQLSEAVKNIERSTKPALIQIREAVEKENVIINLKWGTVYETDHLAKYYSMFDLSKGKMISCTIIIDLDKLNKNTRTIASTKYDEFIDNGSITYATVFTVVVHEIGGHFVFTSINVSEHISPDYDESEDFAREKEFDAYYLGYGKR